MYIKKCSYPQATVYMDCLNQYGIPFEWRIDESKDEHHIVVKSVEPGNIHILAYTFLPSKDIDYPEFGGDLYVRKTEESQKLIAELQPKSLLSTFIDNIDKVKWYDLPFCKDRRVVSAVERMRREIEKNSK